ncbi:hypothetical protein A3A74_05215 [Candidatus Roizmanbacteria bacterium RIFCSPLOWO2_01_FULL_35_13]|uniref:Glycosyltransferase RgtA/B/C/D-like domain-containing protein n=1 Tax=Candidatus Roizmanbacteria bacterium RIFCSPLOWO2_01_FULL_35_13 TaxID=1802055 RepID=A0A1F7I7J3_9BACT|nr:MAG: hypothetical protein A3A74_05215 [Candidatus Roizmanbacteria bacterium RIFCSPLOWO2_01_FULL_35_13]
MIFLAIFFTFIFFYRLDYNTLASWDEAWYGSIARDMARTGDFMNMVWNGKPYYDHPPMGFWLMAISYKFFGVNEFTTRLPSALLGIFSILFMYKIGVELFGKKIIGFASALILGTSVWYVIRTRSGNLESVFVFFYVLTIYLSVKSAKNFNWFPLVMISFGGLILSKTLVGISAIILILYLNFRQIISIKKNFVLILIGGLFFTLAVFPWYSYHIKTYQDFIEYHFIHKGTRNKEFSSYFHPMLEQPLFYLHMGVRKWYYIWLGSLGFLLISFKFIRKNIFYLLLWNFIILYPFLTSKETELWHLIPVYLPLSLIIAVGAYEGIQLVNHVLKQLVNRHSGESRQRRDGSRIDSGQARMTKLLSKFFYLVFFLYIAFLQVKIFYREVYPANKWIPDDVEISRAAGKYNRSIYLDDDYLPIAIFYSGKDVQPLAYLPDDKKTLEKFIQSDEKNYVVITRNWVVDDLKKKEIKYKLLEKNNSFSILTKP